MSRGWANVAQPRLRNRGSLVPRKRLQDTNEVLDTEGFPVCLLLHDRFAAAMVSSRLQIAPTGEVSAASHPSNCKFGQFAPGVRSFSSVSAAVAG